MTTCEKLRWTIANGEASLRPDYRSTNLLLAHKVSKVVYEPLGVVAAIVSWNYPVHNALSPIIAALASGNSIVVKPSENVAWSSLNVIRAVRSCLEACGEVCRFPFAFLLPVSAKKAKLIRNSARHSSTIIRIPNWFRSP